MAPRGTPKAVVDRINADIAAVLAEPDIKEKFMAVGFTPWANTPEGVTKAIEDDSKLFGEVAKREKISLD